MTFLGRIDFILVIAHEVAFMTHAFSIRLLIGMRTSGSIIFAAVEVVARVAHALRIVSLGCVRTIGDITCASDSLLFRNKLHIVAIIEGPFS